MWARLSSCLACDGMAVQIIFRVTMEQTKCVFIAEMGHIQSLFEHSTKSMYFVYYYV